MLNLIHSYPRYLKWKRKDSPNTGKEAQKSAKAAEDDSPKTRKDTVGDDDCAGGSLSPEPIWPTGLTSDPQMDDALVRPKTMEQLTSESSPSTRPNLASSPALSNTWGHSLAWSPSLDSGVIHLTRVPGPHQQVQHKRNMYSNTTKRSNHFVEHFVELFTHFLYVSGILIKLINGTPLARTRR